MARHSFVVLVLAILQMACFAQAPKAEKWTGTPDENELVELVGALFKALNTYWTEAEKITDELKRGEHYQQQDPATTFVPKLLAFEESHRSTEVGLMALRQIVLLAARGGAVDGPADRGRQEVLKRLAIYAAQPMLTEILEYLDAGNFEPAAEQLLRSLAEKTDTDPMVRQYSRLMLAQWMLDARDGREYCERRLQEINGGAELHFPSERKHIEDGLKSYPEIAQVRSWEKEAPELLAAIAKSDEGFRAPTTKAIDPHGYLIRIDEQATKTTPTLSQLAAGLLFKETHLRAGRTAPDFKVSLVSGSDWSLAEQRGKVVIIQFSFKGCGPCEAMYPDLRELQKTLGQRVSILSIMADPQKSSIDEAVSLGRVTWNVAWDGGFNGPLATGWAVKSFPTVYVVGPDGQIAGYGLRGKDLKDKVSELRQNDNE